MAFWVELTLAVVTFAVGSAIFLGLVRAYSKREPKPKATTPGHGCWCIGNQCVACGDFSKYPRRICGACGCLSFKQQIYRRVWDDSYRKFFGPMVFVNERYEFKD